MFEPLYPAGMSVLNHFCKIFMFDTRVSLVCLILKSAWSAKELTFTHFHQLSSTFTHFHPLSPIFIQFHPFSSNFTHFHPISPNVIHFHQVSSNFIQSTFAANKEIVGGQWTDTHVKKKL